MPHPLLDIHNLTFEVDRHPILDRLNLAIESQEIHALLGANGSGKTTLAYVLMGCEGYAPSAGHVQFDDTDLPLLKMHERARLGLTLAWQEPARFEGGHGARVPDPGQNGLRSRPGAETSRSRSGTLSEPSTG